MGNVTELLTTEQAREALGHIGRTTLHRLTVDGSLKSVRIGKRRMYLARSVDELILERTTSGDSKPAA